MGIGTVSAEDTDLVLDLGTQHPSAHGALRLALTLDGDRIATAEPIVGYMHRGAEKLFEVRDYRQILVLTNRHDWTSAFCNELGLAMAVERMLGLEVPQRAVWLRTLLAELNRALNHLAFLGALPGDDPPSTAAARGVLQRVFEEVAGGRVHFMFTRVGGLKDDVPVGWRDRCRTAIGEVRPLLAPVTEQLSSAEFAAATRGIGVLQPALVGQYGVSGPMARASGVAMDLRVDEPYLAYADLPAGVLRVVTRPEGDCLARFQVLAEQAEVSLDIAIACLDRLESLGGPVNVRLPKVVRAPEGETYCWTENPLGINGYWLVSRGEKTPYRLKVRTASFNNVQALRDVLPGARVADLVPILSSTFFVTGDIDK
ncbi:MAG: NADH-quinone oxidoreductase subunit [Frankiaceae bacterium]|nr:NADH-quinone oxidoreductase subunit [Frankiaceae bacterium]